jgi:hypothetical protein
VSLGTFSIQAISTTLISLLEISHVTIDFIHLSQFFRFYAIECSGKNRILVDGQRLDQGDVAILHSGSSIQMNSYHFIFLLPMDATETPFISTTTTTTTTAHSTSTLSHKGVGGGGPATTSLSNSNTHTNSNTTNTTNKVGSSLADHLEKNPIKQLLHWFFEAIESNQWERRHQMIGVAITLHACMDAARSKEIKQLADAQNGVSRSEIMNWIRRSKRYSEWVKHVMNKMELKSYQANVTKCLWKAGFQRNNPVGRFVRWHLPPEQILGPGEPLSEDDDDNHDNYHENTQVRT